MINITPEYDQNLRYSNYRALDENKYYLFKVYKIIKKLNKKYDFKKSLDIGCADASFSKKLKKDLGFNAFGLDISDKAVKVSNKNGILTKKHNLEKGIPFKDEEFDIVIACEIIEHLYDTDFFLEEIRRILKKNGIIIITTPNLASMVNRIKILFGKYPQFVPEYRVGGAGHIRAYTIPILKKQLMEHNFKPILVTSPNITFPMTSKVIPKILKNFAIKLGDYFPALGSHMIIVAVK